MSKKRNRQPRRQFTPTPQKKPQSLQVEDTGHLTVLWSFAVYDNGVKWHDNHYVEHTFQEIAQKIKMYEAMTWSRIESNRNRDHQVDINKLTPKARNRLKKIQQDDIEKLWRFRFNGQCRIWGIRDGRVFKVLWWDPQHKICPAPKKHT